MRSIHYLTTTIPAPLPSSIFPPFSFRFPLRMHLLLAKYFVDLITSPLYDGIKNIDISIKPFKSLNSNIIFVANQMRAMLTPF